MIVKKFFSDKKSRIGKQARSWSKWLDSQNGVYACAMKSEKIALFGHAPGQQLRAIQSSFMVYKWAMAVLVSCK